METALRVNNLTKLYKNGRGVSGLSFEVGQGECFGLLGPNGAGKTTCMKMITGLMRAKPGEISVFGKDVSEKPVDAAFQIGALIESPSFISYLSCEDNMKQAARFYRGAWGNIDAILEKVGLYKYRKDKAAKLSLGMKQRLGIALALVSSPRLLILDEPANGLDIEGMIEIRNLIIELSRNKDTTFLISSHLASEIEKTCQVVGIMNESKLIDVERMDVILENYPSLEDYFIDRVKQQRAMAS